MQNPATNIEKTMRTAWGIAESQRKAFEALTVLCTKSPSMPQFVAVASPESYSI